MDSAEKAASLAHVVVTDGNMISVAIATIETMNASNAANSASQICAFEGSTGTEQPTPGMEIDRRRLRKV
jgi:hypothetical protein